MNTNNPSEIRIIGGKWRGRNIRFLAVPGLRPTPNRIRETLFNWLAPVIHGTNCLDLFAGTGALGFEALSRGAKSVVMIDKEPAVINLLKQNAATLHAENLQILHAVFPDSLSQLKPHQFDIVFLDPPFRHNLLAMCAAELEARGCLATDALIYLEAEKELTTLTLPANWQIIRNKTAGEVNYFLVRRTV